MAIKIFFCYAREDEILLNKLKAHLRPLQHQGLIKLWHDRDISAGTEWEREIDRHLNTAQIILLLVSPDFMDSEYCYSIEMKKAVKRHDQGEARVIPIILRPVYWQVDPLSKLQMLPTDAMPVTSWANPDTAFYDVTIGIEKAIDGWLGLDPYPETAKRAIRKCYCQLGDEEINLLGIPAPVSSSDDIQLTSGRGTNGFKCSFTKGAIYWSGSGDAYAVYGAIGYLYHQRTDIANRLGFPLTGELPAFDSPQKTKGRLQRFESTWDYPENINIPSVQRCGATVYRSEHGAYETWGGIGEYYELRGGTTSFLGFPTSSEKDAAPSSHETTGFYQHFEGGVVFWCEKYGSIPVVGQINTVYDRFNGTWGRFGFPKFPEVLDAEHPGLRFQEFEGGVISVSQ